jgi:hypothetical protein
MGRGKCVTFSAQHACLPAGRETFMKKNWLFYSLLSIAILSQVGMASRGQYDEEARAQERMEKEARKEAKRSGNPVGNMARGVKQATVDSTAGFVSETADGTMEDKPVVGTLEGVSRGTERALDNTVKGAYKVATLGYGGDPSYTVEEPEAGTDEPTKIKIKIPGT